MPQVEASSMPTADGGLASSILLRLLSASEVATFSGVKTGSRFRLRSLLLSLPCTLLSADAPLVTLNPHVSYLELVELVGS